MPKYFTEQQNKDWLAGLPKKSVAVKAVLRSEPGEILLIKPTYKKGWQFPGGGVEPFEEPAEALARELFEELGLKIAPRDLRIVGTVFRQEHDNLILIYECVHPVTEDPQSLTWEDEVEDCRFFAPHAAAQKVSGYYGSFWETYPA